MGRASRKSRRKRLEGSKTLVLTQQNRIKPTSRNAPQLTVFRQSRPSSPLVGEYKYISSLFGEYNPEMKVKLTLQAVVGLAQRVAARAVGAAGAVGLRRPRPWRRRLQPQKRTREQKTGIQHHGGSQDYPAGCLNEGLQDHQNLEAANGTTRGRRDQEARTL